MIEVVVGLSQEFEMLEGVALPQSVIELNRAGRVERVIEIVDHLSHRWGSNHRGIVDHRCERDVPVAAYSTQANLATIIDCRPYQGLDTNSAVLNCSLISCTSLAQSRPAPTSSSCAQYVAFPAGLMMEIHAARNVLTSPVISSARGCC